MATCDYLLYAAIKGIDCANPNAKGVEATGKILNRADIDAITYDADKPNVIDQMALVTQKKAYLITQPNKSPFNGTKVEMAEGTYQNTFTKTLSFVIINHGNNVAKQIAEIANGEFVVVLKNKKVEDGSPAYELFGVDDGLVATTVVRELYNEDVLAGWAVTMTETGVMNPAVFMTEACYDSLDQ